MGWEEQQLLNVARRSPVSYLVEACGPKVGSHTWLAVFPIGCGLASMFAGQDTSWDLFNYQWYIPYAFLNGRFGTDVFPAGAVTTISPLVDVPYYALMHVLPPVIVGGLLGALQGINPVLVFFIAKRLSSNSWVSLACAITSTTGGGFIYELGSVSADSVVSIPLLLGVLLAVSATQPSVTARYLSRSGRAPFFADRIWLLSGMCEGIGAGLKLAEAPFALAATAAVVLTTRGVASRTRRLLITTLGLLLGLGLSYGYWGLFLWHKFGDPFFADLLSVRFFPSKFIVASDLHAFTQGADRYLPGSLTTYLLYPFYWTLHPFATSDSPILDISIPLAYMSVLVLGLVWLWRRVISGTARASVDLADQARAADAYLICTFVVTLALWGKLFGIYRYLIVLELLAPLIIFSVGRRGLALVGPPLAAHLKLRRLSGVIFAGLLLACVLAVLTHHPSGFGSRAPYASRFVSLSTPQVLRADHPDVLIQDGSAPTAMFLPELPSWVTAVGFLDGVDTPATLALVRTAVSRAQRAGGDVVIDFPGAPSQVLGVNTPATDAYLQSEGVTGYQVQGARCQTEVSRVGSDPYPLTFCALRRVGRTRG